MAKEVSIRSSLLKNVLKQEIVSGTKSDFILEAFLNDINAYTLRYITDVLSDVEGDVDLIYPGDFIKFKALNSHVDTKFNPDILDEMGFLSRERNDFYVYGIVLGDDSWQTGYNPYYGKLKIACFYHNEQKQVSYHNDSITTGDVIKIKASQIPKFSTQYEGYEDHVCQLAKLEPLI